MVKEAPIARVFGLDDEGWLKHTNPWSVWSRFASLPLLVLAIWSRVWLGWYSLIPIGLVIFWLIINPTLFRKPDSFDNWAAKAVLGERIWTRSKGVSIPAHHKTAIRILNLLQTLSGLVLAIGLWRLDLAFTLAGTVFVYLTKMWFLDRMVWLYQDMTDAPEAPS